ncbi:hypothetical protein [Lysobacter capsici]|uniref:hypothetical protein n=1 Tax=Lysobacter capsici TaxID=435897 RepID=UPI003D2F7E6A
MLSSQIAADRTSSQRARQKAMRSQTRASGLKPLPQKTLQRHAAPIQPTQRLDPVPRPSAPRPKSSVPTSSSLTLFAPHHRGRRFNP